VLFVSVSLKDFLMCEVTVSSMSLECVMGWEVWTTSS
jgi:hypothetical protein